MSVAQCRSIREKLVSLPFGSIINDFLTYLAAEAGLSTNTTLAYGRDLKGFSEYCDQHGVCAIQDLTPDIIHQYQQFLSKSSVGENTIKRFIVSVRMFLRFAVGRNIIEDDFSGFLETPKLWHRLPIVCSKEQVIRLLDSPDSASAYYLRDKAILELLYATGTRASELSSLKLESLNLKIGYLRCLGKGSKERIVPIGKVAIDYVGRYIDQLRPELFSDESDSWLFLSRTGRRLGRIDIWRLVKKYARLAGMPKNITAHTLRHCFATHLLSGGAGIRTVQELLGHVDIATTQIYTHVDNERLRSLHKKFHPRQ